MLRRRAAATRADVDIRPDTGARLRYANDGAQSFAEYAVDDSIGYPRDVAVADFDGDADLDVVAASDSDDRFLLYGGTGC